MRRALLLMFLLVFGGVARAEEVLRVGVLALRSTEHMREEWQRTFAQVEQALPGVRFEVQVSDYGELESRLMSGELDLLVTNPEHFMLHRQQGLTAIATWMPWTQGRPATQFAGVIFTLRDSQVRTLADVPGASTAAASEVAVGSFLLQRAELLKQGYDVNPRIDFVGAVQDEVVWRVLDGRAQVGFVRTGVLEEMAGEGVLDLARLRIINARTDDGLAPAHSTDLVPEWPVLATARVPLELSRRLAAALVALPGGAEVRAGRSFVFAPPADYAGVEALILRMHRPGREDFSLLDVLRRYAGWVVASLLLLLLVALGALARLLQDQRRLDLAAQEKTQLLASLGEGVLGVDATGTTTYVNDAALEMLRYQRGQVIGRNLHSLIHHHHADTTPYPESECLVRKVLDEGAPRTGEEQLFRSDGSQLPAWRSIVPVREGARVVGAVVTFLDLTARKESEAELKRSRDAAEAANAAKSRFLATMSHEIRTPLNGVLGMAQLLAEPKLSEAERLDYARTILESGGSLLAILNDILDLAKVEAGRLELSPTRMQPSRVLDEVESLFSHVARLRGVAMSTRFVGDPKACVFADVVRVRQMMANLVGNATKFTDHGTIEVEVSLSPEGQLRCEVRDTGPGIPADRLGQLFTPFSQLDTSDTRARGGTGLGLSIVRELAEAMNGEVGVTSTEGAGSCFWFTARFTPCVGAEMHRDTVEIAVVVPRRVLVVEDNAINRRVVEGLLKKLGCTSVSVENGRRAVEVIAEQAPFDLVLMDCQMPEMDGFEATQAVRAREAAAGSPRLRVVALTAAAFEEDRRRCLDAGMDDFLAKPVSIAKLASVLSEAGSPGPSVAQGGVEKRP